MTSIREDLQRRIDAIERGYEFLLAYAAQGLKGDVGSKSGGQLRQTLGEMAAALDGLTDAFRALDAPEPTDAWDNLLGTLEADAVTSLSAVRLVAGRDDISSQLVDNLNVNVHLRALLTDLFLLDDLTER